MNGVEQAVFEEILEQGKAQTDLLKRMLKEMGGKESPDNLFGRFREEAEQSSSVLGGVFRASLVLAASSIGAFTSKLVGAGNTLWQSQMQLAEGAIAGTNSLSSLTEGLQNLPFGLGLVARAMTYQTKVLEKNIETYQQLATIGATLGGNLTEVRDSAKGMGLSMDEFARVMQQNAEVIRYLGSSANEGSRNLINFNKQLVQGSVGRELLGLGYTLEEVNTLLGTYAAVVGGVREGDLKNQKRMEQSVKVFAEELDLAAQLEGKTRKQKEEELKKAAQQAAVEAKLAGMTEEQKKKYASALAAAQKEGQGAVDALHSEMLGFPPMTKAAQMYTAVVGEGAAAQRRQAQEINSSSTFIEARGRMDRNAAAATHAQVKAYEGFGKSAEAATFRADELGNVFRGAAGATAEARNLGLKSEEDQLKRRQQIRAEQEKAEKSQVGLTVQAQAAMKHFGDLMNMLANALAPLFPYVYDLIKAFSEFAPKVIEFAANIVNDVIKPLLTALFGDLDMGDIIKPFRDFFKGFSGDSTLKDVTTSLISVLKPLTDAIGSFFKSIDWVAVGAGVRSVFDVLVNVGKIVGSVLIGAINLAVGVFNVIVATGTALYRIIDYLLKPLGGIADVIEGPMISAFNSISSLLTETIIPWFSMLGDQLSSFASWIDTSTQVIQGPLKFALDSLQVATVGVVLWYGYLKAAQIASFALMQIKDKWETIQIAWMMRKELMEKALAFTSNLVKVGLSAMLGPIGGIVVVAALLVAGFKALYDSGWTFSTAMEAISDNLKRFYLTYVDIWLAIAEKVSSFFGGSDAVTAARAKIAEEKKELDEREKARNAKRAQTKAEREREDSTPAAPAFSMENITGPFSEKSAAAPTAPQQRAAPAGPNAPPPVNQPTAPPQVPGAPAAPTSVEEAMRMGTSASGGSGGAIPDAATLNTNLQQMIRNLRDISDNTKRTADLIASNGNLFRR